MTGDYSQHWIRTKAHAVDGQSPEAATEGFIFDLKRYAIHDGQGIRTTVFLKGCPLRCRWCHNPESWRPTPELSLRIRRCVRCGRCEQVCRHDAVTMVEGKSITDAAQCVLCGQCITECPAGAREIIGQRVSAGEVMAEIRKDIIFYDESGGGVTFSGGEPLMQPEFLLAILKMCRAEDIHTAVDTTCYGEPRLVRRVARVARLFLCDIKHMDSEKHEQYTGVRNEVILDNIKMLTEMGRRVRIRIPIVPGFNADRENIERTAEFVRSLRTVSRIDILPYNQGGADKSVRLPAGTVNFSSLMQTSPPDDDTMEQIATVLRGHGFKIRIGG